MAAAAPPPQARSPGYVYALCEDGTLYARPMAADQTSPDFVWTPLTNVGTNHRVIAVDEGYLYGIRGHKGTVDAQTVRNASEVGWRTIGANGNVISIAGQARQLYAIGDKSGGDSVLKLEQPRSSAFPAWVPASKGRSYFMAIHAGTLYALGNALKNGQRWVYKQPVTGMSPLSRWEAAFQWADGLGPFAVISQGDRLVALAPADNGHVASLEMGGADAMWGLEPRAGLGSQRVIAITACAGACGAGGGAACRAAGPAPAPAAPGRPGRGSRTPSPARDERDGGTGSCADAEDFAARLASAAALGGPRAEPGRELAPWCPTPPVAAAEPFSSEQAWCSRPRREPAGRGAPPPPEHFPDNPWRTADAYAGAPSSAPAARRGGYRKPPEQELRQASSDDGRVEDVRRLLSEGVPTDGRDGGGKTPLHYAARSGAVACVQALLDHKADPNVGDTTSNLRPVDEAEYWAVKRPSKYDDGSLRTNCLQVLQLLRAFGGERCPIAERLEPSCALSQRAKLEEEARLRGIPVPWADEMPDAPLPAQAASAAPAGAAAGAWSAWAAPRAASRWAPPAAGAPRPPPPPPAWASAAAAAPATAAGAWSAYAPRAVAAAATGAVAPSPAGPGGPWGAAAAAARAEPGRGRVLPPTWQDTVLEF